MWCALREIKKCQFNLRCIAISVRAPLARENWGRGKDCGNIDIYKSKLKPRWRCCWGKGILIFRAVCFPFCLCPSMCIIMFINALLHGRVHLLRSIGSYIAPGWTSGAASLAGWLMASGSGSQLSGSLMNLHLCRTGWQWSILKTYEHFSGHYIADMTAYWRTEAGRKMKHSSIGHNFFTTKGQQCCQLNIVLYVQHYLVWIVSDALVGLQ